MIPHNNRTNKLYLSALIIIATVISPPPICLSLHAATYYISANGLLSGDGSRERPWPADIALMEGGGNNYVFLPGIYRGPLTITSKHAGTEERPTIFRSDVKWKAQIIGAASHGITIERNAPYVIIDGFEVWGAGNCGIISLSNHTTIRNCWIHNNITMGVVIHKHNNAAIENNLIEYNGMHPQFHHGIYMDGVGHLIRNNIVRHNSAYGIHLYPDISQSIIVNNLIYGHSNRAGIILVNNDKDGGLKFINNTVANNAIGIRIWGSSNISIENNIFFKNRSTFSFHNSAGKHHNIDYNLYDQKIAIHGLHDIVGDPQFVNADLGLYWLSEKSAAIGRGNVDSAPQFDIWGTPRASNRAPDIGAYQYMPIKFSDKVIKRWQYGSRFDTPASGKIPDLWQVPSATQPQH